MYRENKRWRVMQIERLKEQVWTWRKKYRTQLKTGE